MIVKSNNDNTCKDENTTQNNRNTMNIISNNIHNKNNNNSDNNNLSYIIAKILRISLEIILITTMANNCRKVTATIPGMLVTISNSIATRSQ